MKSLKLQSVRLRGITVLALAALALTPACRTPEKTPNPAVRAPADPAVLMAAHLEEFNSGTPEAKQAWDLAAAAVNGNDFEAALSTLEQLRGQSGLSSEQIQAVDATLAAVRQRAKTAKPH